MDFLRRRTVDRESLSVRVEGRRGCGVGRITDRDAVGWRILLDLTQADLDEVVVEGIDRGSLFRLAFL